MPRQSDAALTARSVLASALLGEDPPELAVSHLVHLAGLFGINENRARVALSRMATAGEVTTDGAGRYRLAGHLLERQGRQAGSRRGDTRPWGGRWRMVVVTGSGRSPEERSARRKRMALARLAEQREGVWLRPDNIELVPDPAGDPDAALFSATPVGDAVELASSLWDLTGWAGGADRLHRRMEALPPTGPGRPGARVRAVGVGPPPPAGRPPPAPGPAAGHVAGPLAARGVRPVGSGVPEGPAHLGPLRLRCGHGGAGTVVRGQGP